jgi:hypothetical protein
MRRHSLGSTPSIGHGESSHPTEQDTRTVTSCRRSFWKNKKNINKESEPPPVSYKTSPTSHRRGAIGSIIFRRNSKISSCCLNDDEVDAAAVCSGSNDDDITSVYSGFSVITFDDDEIDGIIKSIGRSTPLAWCPSSQFRRRSSIN